MNKYKFCISFKMRDTNFMDLHEKEKYLESIRRGLLDVIKGHTHANDELIILSIYKGD